MKSLICYLVLIFSTFVLRAQTTYPLTQNIGSPITKVTIPNYGAYYGGLIPLKFADTSAANTALTYGKNYDGFLIMTLSPPALWWRYYTDSTKWVQILPSGSSGGTLAWVMGGNNPVVTDVSLYGLLGTKPNNGLSLITNNIVRFSINTSGAFGIGSGRDFGTSGYLLQSNGSGSAPSWVSTSGLSGWSLTGNAGTTAGTNFIGTTDNVDLVLKRNSVHSGRIGSSNTSFGYASLNLTATGVNNSAFGGSSLNALTTGNGNSVFGLNAGQFIDAGEYNTAIGHRALENNEIGDYNTSLGYYSGYNTGTTTANNNLFLGSYSGKYMTTEANRIFLNTLDRTDKEGDTISSPIYIAQHATAASQRLYLNSRVFAPYIPNTVTANSLYYDATTKEFSYGTAATGTVTGTGTANTMTKWTSSTAVGNSGTTADGTNVTMTENLLFSADNTKDIGASGATRPRTGYFGTSLVSPLYTTTSTGQLSNGTSYVGFNGNNVILGTNSANRTIVNVIGDTYPNGNNTQELGVSGQAWKNLYVGTAIYNPLLIGGTTTTSPLTYKTTTGVGTTGADHIFKVGNNGATEAMRILNSGNVGIGTSTPATNMEVYVTANAGGIRATSNGTASPLLGLYNGSTEEGGIGWAQSANRFASGAGAGDIVVYAYDAGGTHKLNFATGSSPTVRMTIDGNGNVGIGTTSPNSTLHTNGSFATAYRAITALRTLDGTDYTIEVTANTFTVTLPTAVGITGRIYVITNSGSGVTTVGTTSSQTFANVLTTPTTLSLAQYSTVMVQSNGANWLRLTNL